jgi:capsular exopolysaccharide synthesis family protein
MLQSAEVLDGAKRRLELELPGVNGDVDITPALAPRTSIFTVSGTGTNPDYTQHYVDAVVAEFIAFRKRQRGEDLNEANSEVASELDRVRKKLKQESEGLQAFVEKNNIPYWKQTSDSASKYLSDLKSQQAQLQNELNRLQSLTSEQLLSSPAAGARMERDPQAAAPTSRNEVVFANALQDQYLEASQLLRKKKDELDRRSQIWKPKHPRLQMLKDEVMRGERQVETIKKQNEEMTQSRVVAIKAELRSLDSSINTWSEKAQEANRIDMQHTTLLESVNRTQKQEDDLLNQLGKLDSTTGITAGLLKVVRKATPPVLVPKATGKHLTMGLIGGLLIGGLVLFLLDRADDRLSSSSEVLQHFTEPIVGQVPNVADTRRESGLPLLQPEDERYTYAESFRSLRSSLIFMPNQAELKTLLITSAIPNEGKSTVASNLAITMAASGARVLLVDADLRRGDLAALFDTDGRHGLSGILREEVAWKSAVQETKYPTLHLIPRGSVTNQSGELLLKPCVERLLEEFKAAYDLVIFNTAPILATDDTPTLAPHFDGSLMIVRAQFTSARLTQNALNALYQRQVNVLGLILNCVDVETPDYYYYRYPKYYAA